MPLDLAPGEHHHLPGSPLTLVVCQIRFDATPAATDSATILAVHEGLGGKEGRYPVLERAQAAPLLPQQVAEMPVVIPQIPFGWRYKSQDGTWIVSIFPDSVSLETTTGYTSWAEDFRARLVELVGAISKHISPAMVQRVGLRYIDQISRPQVDTPSDWAPYISPEVLGPLLHPAFGDAITRAQQQLDLDIGEGVRCGLRHGFFPDQANAGRLTYILDTDVFRDEIRRYDDNQIMDDANRFHNVALGLFRAVITPDLMTIFEEA
jgi:uncharacterized protein (TIGR04255 family)